MTTGSSNVKTGYDRWSTIYDHDLNPLQGLEDPILRAAIGDVRGIKVLDLGCGTGRHSIWLAAAGASVTAVDFSEGMLGIARSKPGAEAITFLVHDLHQPLPFSDASFDLIVSSLVLEHLQGLTRFFSEARRVLRSPGRAVISTMHPAMFLRGSQARFTDPQTGAIVQPGSINHAFGEIVMATIHAGFHLEGIREYAPDAAFAAAFLRAQKYVDWPMLVVLQLTA